MPSETVQGVQCPSCGKVLVSYHRHDYKLCGCANETMIDGGRHYLRYGGHVMPAVVDVQDTFAPNDEEIALVREGKMVLAIRDYRQRTGVGLKEAKHTMDEVRDIIAQMEAGDEQLHGGDEGPVPD